MYVTFGASNDECFMMFHNVLSVFHDVLLVAHDFYEKDKNFTKRGPTPISLRSEYSSFNWYINTPISRHLFNTNNTNVYSIHFHSKNNIKIPFPKSLVFKVSNQCKSFIIHRNTVK